MCIRDRVYTAKSFSRRTLDVMLGFAAGVMIAASYWSLLAPALEMSSHLGRLACVPVALGFLVGAGVLRLVDLILPHIHPTENVPDGPPSKLPRSALLVFAITLHNIPEGDVYKRQQKEYPPSSTLEIPSRKTIKPEKTPEL